MAVDDRWHKDPAPGDEPCKCGRGRNRLYPGGDHLKGARWKVRWRDPATGRQKSKNFALRDPDPGQLADPDKHASAYDKVVQGSIVTRSYRDPNAGMVTLQEYAETWRTNRRPKRQSTVRNLEARLRLHVYPAEPGGKKTPKGAPSIGQHALAVLEQRPSLVAGWVAAIPLAEGSARLVVGDVSAIFKAARADGVIGSNPVESDQVDRPGKGGTKALPYSAADVAAITAGLPERFRIIPEIGVTAGPRKMEMMALGADDIVRGKAPKLRVQRQLLEIDGELRFGPLKNSTSHDVPVPAELVEHIDAHLARFPPRAVTLPWHEPESKLHGEPHPVRLILSGSGGRPVTVDAFDAFWVSAIVAWRDPRGPRNKRVRTARGFGVHRTRHTAASSWLRAGIDVVRVASWLGDTVEVVVGTYAHLMPDDHDGDEAGRVASAAFLSACVLNVPGEAAKAPSRLMNAV